MKVLFISNVPSPYRIDFFNELGKLCDLTVLFETKYAKSRNDQWKDYHFNNFHGIFLRGIRIGDAEAFCPGIVNYLEKKDYDIIVVSFYSSPTGMLAIQYLNIKKIPFILSSDGGRIKNEKGLRYKFKEHFIGSAYAWLSTGKSTSEYFEFYGAKKEKIFIYPFTSVKKSQILKKSLTDNEKNYYKKKIGITEEKVIVSVGQFIYRKGYDILLNACKDLDKNIGIYIIGGEPTEEYITIQNNNSLNNVHFIGFKSKSDLSDYYRAADLFVLPTRDDIWGLVVNEAMAYGLPVITTDKCVAGLEMITDDRYGEILEFDKFQNDFKDSVERNIHKSSLPILELARNYSIEKMAERHIEIFKGLIND